MDERDVSPAGHPLDAAALAGVHRGGVLATIAAAVAVCGFGVQAFLGHLGTGSADVGGSVAADAAGGTVQVSPTPADSFRLPPPADVTPSLDEQTAFLVAVQQSGTGGWSTRFEIVGYGLRACRLLSTGSADGDVVSALVASGESRDQAVAVVATAPQTLCPPSG